MKELNSLRLLPPWHALGRSDLAIDIAESLQALSPRKGSLRHFALPPATLLDDCNGRNWKGDSGETVLIMPGREPSGGGAVNPFPQTGHPNVVAGGWWCG